MDTPVIIARLMFPLSLDMDYTGILKFLDHELIPHGLEELSHHLQQGQTPVL